MPARLVYCRRYGCGYATLIHCGVMPTGCPVCRLAGIMDAQHSGFSFMKPMAPPAVLPVVYELTHNDYWLFLRRLRIAPG